MTPPTRTFTELASLSGRVALVTGANGHIGSVFCSALEELGARVAAADLAAAGHAEESRGRERFPVDLRSEQDTRQLIPRVLDRFGRLDVFVHCAAYVGTTSVEGWSAPFGEQSVAAWDEALRVNLTAAFVLGQEARAALTRSGHGSIVLVSSIYGVVSSDPRLYDGTEMHSPAGYSASKAGLIQLARHMAVEFAPGVRVNTLAPGGVWRAQPRAFVERYEARTPLRRMAREEDLKGALAFLASDLSSYVTGHNLVVDGGWTTW